MAGPRTAPYMPAWSKSGLKTFHMRQGAVSVYLTFQMSNLTTVVIITLLVADSKKFCASSSRQQNEPNGRPAVLANA